MSRLSLLLSVLILAFGCDRKRPTIAEQAAAEDAELVSALKVRLDRGERLSDLEVVDAWMACGRHPTPSCADVMARAPQPLITSWDTYFEEPLRTVTQQQAAGTPVDPWRIAMLRAVCARNRPSLRNLCAIAKLP